MAFRLRALASASTEALQRFIRPSPSPQLCLSEFNLDMQMEPVEHSTEFFGGSLWFAVPKKKVSRSKKRMKTTFQKRIKMKNNIIVDKRTGELTLMHHLPHNWKDYLPKFDTDKESLPVEANKAK
mmetsp:Transcript_4233/g.6153  ORF Transcript_4233/g.6153 Transcript_4233/m.6153 type:complete len:125 (-) Transcript_4233:337-711(-)|eukprot:CAMPEP_0195513852 /NCGR_PEP_ID=MMETSP0794_2-20130614/5411_1 /TAXON_ID=515487 /ORGANISM="Stephanopyxis turris, Strain CCMP 815" /LENGTH=124 /DNA_ID=CAMNT_0040641963 /DNA_START=177 /DNA_END=551 /DNA_ORIENTATION=-